MKYFILLFLLPFATFGQCDYTMDGETFRTNFEAIYTGPDDGRVIACETISGDVFLLGMYFFTRDTFRASHKTAVIFYDDDMNLRAFHYAAENSSLGAWDSQEGAFGNIMVLRLVNGNPYNLKYFFPSKMVIWEDYENRIGKRVYDLDDGNPAMPSAFYFFALHTQCLINALLENAIGN